MFSPSKIIRVAAVALALGATSFAAAPAQAQPSVEFHFGGPGFGVHIDSDRRGHYRPGRHCLTNPQVRRDLQRDGYRNIRFLDRRGRIVHVRASLRRADYRIAYDTCRARIVDRDRIWRRW